MARTARREDEAEAKERILAAAVRMFAQKGYDGAAIVEITDLAGVNRGLPFYYWGSKRALYAAIVREGLGRFITTVEEALSASGGYSERLGRFIQGHLALLWHEADRMRVVDRCLLDGHVVELGLGEQFAGTMQRFEQFFRDAAAAGEFRAVDPAFAARLMLGPGFIFSMWKLFEGDRFSEAELAELITAQLLSGFHRRGNGTADEAPEESGER